MKRFLSVCSVFVVGAGIGVAHADVINVTLNTGLGCATTSCGTITITDVSGGVTVTEALSPNYFVVTGHDGNHPSLAMDLDATPTSFTGWSSLPTGETWNTSTNADPAGYKPNTSNGYDFDYYVYLSGGSGGSGTHVTSLSFTIEGVTTGDFDLTTPFVSDIADVSDDSKTGNVSGVGSLTVTPIPEPSSLALLGSSVLGLAGVVRRRFKR